MLQIFNFFYEMRMDSKFKNDQNLTIIKVRVPTYRYVDQESVHQFNECQTFWMNVRMSRAYSEYVIFHKLIF